MICTGQLPRFTSS